MEKPASKDFKPYPALGNIEYIVCQPPRGLQKDLKKEKWEGKAIVIKE